MNPRIAYLVSRYPAISHTFILREVRSLRRRGFEIHTASINRPDRPASQLTAEERAEAETTYYIKSAGAPAVAVAVLRKLTVSPLQFIAAVGYALRLAGLNLPAALFNLFYFVEALLLSDWMRRRQLSHVHVHFATPAATVALIASRLGVEFSMTVHGPDEFDNVDRYFLAEKIRRARFVCCISQFCRGQLMKLSAPAQWHKLEVCRLGVNPEHFHPQPRQLSFNFRLLCVGRLVAAKGQSLLLSAVRRLVDEGRNPLLTLVGDGPDRRQLEEQAAEIGIADRVFFAGSVSQDQIREHYLRADALVLPSFAEGVPVVLMEAMAMEIPCISTTIAGIPELIESGSEGLLVPASDIKLLAEAISKLEDSPQLADRLARQGRQRVIQAFNLEDNADRLAAILRNRLRTPLATEQLSEVLA